MKSVSVLKNLKQNKIFELYLRNNMPYSHGE